MGGRKIQRYEPHYLTQVVHKWIVLLRAAKLDMSSISVHLSVCNVDEDPRSYREAEELKRFVPMVTRFNNYNDSKFHLTNSMNIERKRKEKQDFVFCQSEFLANDTDYLLVVEDDAMPKDDFITVLNHVIHTHLEYNIVRGDVRETGGNVSWVKLYHPEAFSLFVAYEYERVPEWLALSAVLGSLLTFINCKLNMFKGNI